MQQNNVLERISVRVRSSHQPFGTVTLQLYINIPLNSVRAILIIAATQFFNRTLARVSFKTLVRASVRTLARAFVKRLTFERA